MATEPITLNVDAEAARVFKAASPDERRKLEALVSLQPLDMAKPSLPRRELMELIGQRAADGTYRRTVARAA
ncbi:MAG TPA: hypothetical protein VGP82_22555 [Ktedonobacterales bacterium]|jgi:hypothetical protein|nr:hypothetical protein [Ktedonobacterales bacterium]